MIARRAEPGDRLTVVRLLKEFHAESGVPFPFHAAYAERMFLVHCAGPEACCFVVGDMPVGFLMGATFDHPFGWGKWAKESFLFVGKEHRGNRLRDTLLDAYEAWARSLGCVVSGMVSLAGNDVSGLYLPRGYRAMETHFVKAL